MLGCGAISVRNPRNFGGPIFTIEGMSLMNPWRGNESGLILASVLFCTVTTKGKKQENTHAASIYSLGGDVSDKASKDMPIPAWPISSRETRHDQTSMSSSEESSCNRLTKVSSS